MNNNQSKLNFSNIKDIELYLKDNYSKITDNDMKAIFAPYCEQNIVKNPIDLFQLASTHTFKSVVSGDASYNRLCIKDTINSPWDYNIYNSLVNTDLCTKGLYSSSILSGRSQILFFNVSYQREVQTTSDGKPIIKYAHLTTIPLALSLQSSANNSYGNTIRVKTSKCEPFEILRENSNVPYLTEVDVNCSIIITELIAKQTFCYNLMQYITPVIYSEIISSTMSEDFITIENLTKYFNTMLVQTSATCDDDNPSFVIIGRSYMDLEKVTKPELSNSITIANLFDFYDNLDCMDTLIEKIYNIISNQIKLNRDIQDKDTINSFSQKISSITLKNNNIIRTKNIKVNDKFSSVIYTTGTKGSTKFAINGIKNYLKNKELNTIDSYIDTKYFYLANKKLSPSIKTTKPIYQLDKNIMFVDVVAKSTDKIVSNIGSKFSKKDENVYYCMSEGQAISFNVVKKQDGPSQSNKVISPIVNTSPVYKFNYTDIKNFKSLKDLFLNINTKNEIYNAKDEQLFKDINDVSEITSKENFTNVAEQLTSFVTSANGTAREKYLSKLIHNKYKSLLNVYYNVLEKPYWYNTYIKCNTDIKLFNPTNTNGTTRFSASNNSYKLPTLICTIKSTEGSSGNMTAPDDEGYDDYFDDDESSSTNNTNYSAAKSIPANCDDYTID